MQSWVLGFDVIPELYNGKFLMISFSVESETRSVNFLFSVRLKAIGLSCALSGFLPLPDFVTSLLDLMANIGSRSYTNLFNVDTFLYIIPNN